MLESKNSALRSDLESQEKDLTKRLKSFIPSFEKVKIDAEKEDTETSKKIKMLEGQNDLLIEDLKMKCKEFMTMSLQLDELRGKQKLIHKYGSVEAVENEELRQKVSKLTAQSKSYLKLAAARSESLRIIENALQSAVEEKEEYKRKLEELQNSFLTPNFGAGRRTRVVPQARRRYSDIVSLRFRKYSRIH